MKGSRVVVLSILALATVVMVALCVPTVRYAAFDGLNRTFHEEEIEEAGGLSWYYAKRGEADSRTRRPFWLFHTCRASFAEVACDPAQQAEYCFKEAGYLHSPPIDLYDLLVENAAERGDDELLEDLAEKYAELSQWDEAQKIAESISDPLLKVYALVMAGGKAVAEGLSPTRWVMAMEAVFRSGSLTERGEFAVLALMGEIEALAFHRDHADSLFGEARGRATLLPVIEERFVALERLIKIEERYAYDSTETQRALREMAQSEAQASLDCPQGDASPNSEEPSDPGRVPGYVIVVEGFCDGDDPKPDPDFPNN